MVKVWLGIDLMTLLIVEPMIGDTATNRDLSLVAKYSVRLDLHPNFYFLVKGPHAHHPNYSFYLVIITVYHYPYQSYVQPTTLPYLYSQ